MLVTFSCSAHADITMFGEVAKELLELMGHSGTVPGALRAEDVGPALARLRAAVEAQEARVKEQQTSQDEEEDEDDEDEPAVPTHRRARPLISLLEAASAQGCDVMWEGRG